MTFYVGNQKDLTQLRCQAPLPALVSFMHTYAVEIGAEDVPFICHDGVRTLQVAGKVTFVNSSRKYSDGLSVKDMFGERLSSSTKIEELRLLNCEIRDIGLYSLHRKPLLDSLKSLTLEFPSTSSKSFLSFARTIAFSLRLVTLNLYDTNSGVPSIIAITTAVNIFWLLFLNQSLKTMYLPGRYCGGFSKLGLALMHKILNESNRKWPKYSILNLGTTFLVKQILAQLARRCSSPVLKLSSKDFNLLSTKQRDYLSSRGICSSFYCGHYTTLLTLN